MSAAKKTIYESFMSILAIIAVIFAIKDFSGGLAQWQIICDAIIYLIFLFDYLIRLIRSENKKAYIKENILDLISIIPFNSAFRIFRVARLAKLARLSRLSKLSKLIRVSAYIGRAANKCKTFFNTNGFKYMLLLAMAFIGIGSIAIHYAEGMPLSDAVWWAFVTTTTVGYGDISPASPLGRIIAMLLMIIGIGLIGSLTSTITSFFINTSSKTKSMSDETLEHIKLRIDDVKNLSDEDIDHICSILKTMNK